MPTYQYKCTKCGFGFEEFQAMTDLPLEKCPRCGGRPERIISGGAGFLFKGSGFYITDHRSGAYKEAAKKDNGEVTAGATGGTKKEPAASPPKKNE
ncbi:MAG: zinc ribbon domain-containing protein [Candidatus Zixiibacteriota bacterium]|nr:MAG: zinc ribbon domain-containing protein [candidate division Zixibacteria bacterium]